VTTDRDTPLKQIQQITQPLTSLKGVGPKRAALLAQKGLHTIIDLLFFTPIRYEDRTRIFPISEAEEDRAVLVKGRVVYGREERYFPSRKRLFKILIRDGEGSLELLWFQYKKPHLERFTSPGTDLLAYGRIKRNRGIRQMVHPDLTMTDYNGEGGSLGFYPVYPVTRGVSLNVLRSLIRKALDRYQSSLIDPIPRKITRNLCLPELAGAIKYVHFPSRESSIDRLNQFDTPFHKRLVFDRFFMVLLTITFGKRYREKRSSPIFQVPPDLIKNLEMFFSFQLTADQIRAIKDVASDLATGKPMTRLLMGDVGCGKTVVAAVAAHIGIRNNSQVALMVPTQVLANQHQAYFLNLSHEMGFRPVLLTSRLKKAERQRIYEEIGKGHYNLIIGTQALIQERLAFARLGLVIIDEQHRFGVRERALMDRKGENPHLLVMTATPIPRTLAITVYGDMDISIIKEYPKGRRPVVTRLVEGDGKRTVFETLIRRLSSGQQAFVICPVIERSEERDLKNAMEMAEKLKKILSPRLRVGLIHGRLASDEREEVMDHFRSGLIHLLVGTTVIEVGVHVPGATVMVIEHPERFGLAQLHQLRGRVGRGAESGLCFLMLDHDISEKAISRLNILAKNHDGFEIAQNDLEIRGQGELTGMRQAGMGELDFTEIVREQELLLRAKREARRLIDADPDLLHPDHNQLKGMVQSVLAKPLDL